MVNHEQLSSSLIKLGLKAVEASVYLSILEEGEATILTTSQRTGIKRGTVYEIVDRLTDRGFIKTTLHGKKRYFLAEDPRTLTAKFREHTDTLLSQLPELLALQNSNTNKPKITFYEGEEEVFEIYEDTLRTNQPILSYTSVVDVYKLLDPGRIEEYIKKRVQKKIPVKIIALESEAGRLWSKRSPKEFREILLLPRDQYNFSADMEIYGNKVAIISFKEDIFGIIIESEQISQMYKSAFELMWQAVKTISK
jgi:HTH-type transcriptional regulator, sugar sensing transcriptional regulator